MELAAYLAGFGVLLVFWLLYWALAGSPNPFKLVNGADGRPSSSKFQWFLWTLVVIFAYIVIYAARVVRGNYAVIADIPPNVLIAMGLSITTMTAAKGITSSYVAHAQVNKSNGGPATGGLGALFCDDDGLPDLSKIQMLAWTLIASGIYIMRLVIQVRTGTLQLPDIDPALMVLMGLGQAAYIGKKLTTTDVPILNGVAPSSGKAGTSITLTGSSFGPTQAGSEITIDGDPIQPTTVQWADGQITFPIPDKHPLGAAWAAGQRISLGLIVGGRASANTLPFTVTSNGAIAALIAVPLP